MNLRKSVCTLIMLIMVLQGLLLTGCGPGSLEDYREEGQGISRSLTQELQLIHTREELIQSVPTLQKLFEDQVDIIIAARKFHNKHPRMEEPALTKEDRELSEDLRSELNRMYQLEGGREIIEKCQEKALLKLDISEKRLTK